MLKCIIISEVSNLYTYIVWKYKIYFCNWTSEIGRLKSEAFEQAILPYFAMSLDFILPTLYIHYVYTQCQKFVNKELKKTMSFSSSSKVSTLLSAIYSSILTSLVPRNYNQGPSLPTLPSTQLFPTESWKTDLRELAQLCLMKNTLS